MNFTQKKKSSGKSGGYMLALLLCIAAVFLVAWSTTIGTQENDDDLTDDVPSAFSNDYIEPTDSLSTADLESLSYDVQDEGEDYLEDISLPPDTTTTAAETTTAAPITTTAPKTVEAAASAAAAPVAGTLLKEFSGSSLVYCKTLGDWRVHQGMDIACSEGAKIYSCTAGTVASISEDSRYGTTVCVRCDDETMIYYCGLDKNVTVTAGEAVDAGHQLGVVGIVPCEVSDGTHLHMMVMRSGEYVDPRTIIEN